MNVEGGGLFSLLSTKAMYGALCPAISTPIHEQEGFTGLNPVKATKMARRLEHLP